MKDRKEIALSLTHAAEVFGRARSDLDGLKRAAEEAVQEIYDTYSEKDEGPDDIMDIAFFVFSWNGDHNLMLVPARDRSVMFVDLCIMEEMPVPKRFENLPEDHPLKGKRLMMPRPFSIDDNDEDEDDE